MNSLRTMLHQNRGFLVFILAFALIRTAVADYNPIPSGSMHPTILEGDVVLVNRLAYNLKVPLTDIVLARTGDPQRGDIVTFTSPRDGVRLIKRVVGLPGDVIQMHDKRLRINGRDVGYAPVPTASGDRADGDGFPAVQLTEELGRHPYRIQWLTGVESAPSFDAMRIPPDHFLMLGDNRDNSADSRFIGLVSRELLIGRAQVILASAAITSNGHPRLSRFGKNLYP